MLKANGWIQSLGFIGNGAHDSACGREGVLKDQEKTKNLMLKYIDNRFAASMTEQMFGRLENLFLLRVLSIIFKAIEKSIMSIYLSTKQTY